ncbi:MAG: hypothetical protein RMK29_16400 [Myxococcales bacterium]|nr:hypothetical protein [Myxococcota bacterium]MDW8283294.1 hypothetical protein [Myxococcales bacterium]
MQVKSTGPFTLEIAKNTHGTPPGELNVMVEVAGRTSIRLRPASGRRVHATGGRMQLLATLTPGTAAMWPR